MKLLTKKNYLNAVRKSAGTEIFQNVFADHDGKEVDITQNGQLSCALFVSSTLKLFNLIDINKAPHTTVSGILKNMIESGWQEVSPDNINEGDVLIWEKIIDTDGKEHEHIGFYMGKNTAMSNSSKKKTPGVHSYDYDKKRKIISAWRYPNF